MRMRTLPGVVLVGAVAATALSLHAQVPLDGGDPAPTAGSIPSARDRIVWTAGALGPLLADRDYPSVLFISALGRVVEERGEAALDGLEPALAALAASRPSSSFPTVPVSSLGPASGLAGLPGCRTEASNAGAALCSMEHLVPLVPADLAREVTEEGARLVALYSAPTGVSDPLQSFAADALERAWRVRMAAAEQGSPAASALDGVLGGLVGLSPHEGASEVLGRVPALGQLLDAHPVIAGLLPFPRPAGSVLEEYQAFLGGVTGSLGGLLLSPPSPDAARSSVAPSLAAGLLGSPGLERSAVVSAWAARRSFVYLAARSAELAGAAPSVSERMLTLGSAAVDLRREAASFPSSLVGMGRDLAVATLTGNILGVASRITSFFQGNPGALGFGAGREVHALREGIEAMRVELRAGFDGMDQRVDEVLEVLDARLGRLEVLVESNGRGVQAELASLHEGVLVLGERLDRMDVTLRSYMQAGFDREYARTLVRCLEHRERYLPPFDEMDFHVFSECLSDFRTRAVGDARDALLTDQVTPVDDLSLLTALSDPSLENLAARLPLLGRAAEQRYTHSGLRGGRGLANAVEWTVASEAYVSMLRDWPIHARAITAGDLETIRAVGLELHAALQAIALDGATGARSGLLERVLDDYQDGLTDLVSEADVLARRHRQEVLLRVSPEDVLARLQAEDARLPDLPVPEVVAHAVPQEVRTAVVLGLDSASLVYRIVSVDSVFRGDVRRRFIFFGKRHDRFTYTRSAVEVELRVASVGTVARYGAAGPYHLRLTEEMDGDERSERVRKRANHLGDPALHFLADTWPRVATGSEAWNTPSPGTGIIRGIEARIEAEIRRHATVGLNNVFTSVCSEGIETPGLSTADRGSALAIRNALNGLSAARALFESYLRLGLPDAVASDVPLREALFGPEAILDRAALCAVVASGESAIRLVWLEEEPSRRALALAVAIDAVLDAAVRAAGASGPSTLVDETLERLDTAIRLQRLRAAVAATG